MNAAALDSIWDASAWNFHHPCQSITPPTSDWSVVRSKKLSWKSLTPLKTATSWKILKTFATFPTNLAASPFPERFEDMLIFEMQFPCQRQGWVSSSNHWIGHKIFCLPCIRTGKSTLNWEKCCRCYSALAWLTQIPHWQSERGSLYIKSSPAASIISIIIIIV